MREWDFTLHLHPGKPYHIKVRAPDMWSGIKVGMRCARLETNSRREIVGMEINQDEVEGI